MAPTLAPEVVILYPWEVFTAIVDGQPAIGARLWTFAPNTTTPKAAYHDPFYLNEQTNPIIMNAQGQAVVWLKDFYHLRLEDRYGQLLWEIESYEFVSGATPPEGGFVTGITESGTVLPTAGTSVISVPNLVPVGYRVEGIIVKIDTEFGASNGLSSIAIGDNVSADRWGVVLPTVGQATTQVHFRSADRPIAATAYSVLLSALGGTFDAAGACTVRAFWSSITGWA